MSVAQSHPPYRPDIDGLRAVAVVSVVGYHAFPVWFAGGFIGVDVFFVISGFLISTILINGLRADRFSYRTFYERRIRRLFPALLVVLLACLVAGWFVLYAAEYAQLGKHTAGGLGFIDNVLYWQESGYFDTSRTLKPLLHLWSLGVEEQFYLAWPLLLGLVWRRTHSATLLIGALWLASLTLNLTTITSHPNAAFYLPGTRFWELMTGAALAHAQLSAPAPRESTGRAVLPELVSLAGLALLVVGFATISEERAFPGAWALLPAMGAACFIAAGPHALLNRFVLSLRPLVFIGLISYPLYLWHWPLIAFMSTLGFDQGPYAREIRVGVVLASFVLAWATWRWVERPLRTSADRRVALYLAFGGVLLAAVGIVIFASGGVPKRAINDNETLRFLQRSDDDNAALRNSYTTQACDLGLSAEQSQYCWSYGQGTSGTIVVWGDSHAWAWAPVFYQIAKERGLRVVVFSHGGCPPLLDTRRTGAAGAETRCTSTRNGAAVLDAIRRLQPSRVFLVSFWSLYAHLGDLRSEPVVGETPRASPYATKLRRTLDELGAVAPVTLFRTTPRLLNRADRALLRNMPLEPSIAQHRQFEAGANAVIDDAVAGATRVTLFDPAERLCTQRCRAVLDGTLLYADENHLTSRGTLLFKDDLLGAFFNGEPVRR